MRTWSADMITLLSTNPNSVKLPSVFRRINFGAMSYKEGVNLIADLLKTGVEKEVMMGDDLTAQDVQGEIAAQLAKIADGSTALPHGLTIRNEGSGSSAFVSSSGRDSSFGGGRFYDSDIGSNFGGGGGGGGGRFYDDRGGGFGCGRFYEDRGEDDAFASSPQGKSSGRGTGSHAHTVKSLPKTGGAGRGSRRSGGGGGGGDDDDDDDEEDD